MGVGDGLKTALDLVAGQERDQVLPGDAPAEQLALLSDPREEFARNVGIEVLEGAGDPNAPRGPGRPKGSRSKKTEEWVDFILSHYGSPLVHLAKTMVADTAELAKAMGVKRGEAASRQQAAAIALLPYIHQKLPQTIDLDKGVTVLNVIVAGSPNAATQAVLDGSVIEIEENQQLGEKDSGDV